MIAFEHRLCVGFSTEALLLGDPALSDAIVRVHRHIHVHVHVQVHVHVDEIDQLRSTRRARSTLPAALRGSSGTETKRAGILNFASRPRKKARSSLSAAPPATYATPTCPQRSPGAGSTAASRTRGGAANTASPPLASTFSPPLP